MRKVVGAFILFLCLASQGATSPQGRERLVQLLKLPTMEAGFGINFSLDKGLVLQKGTRDVYAEIEALKKELSGGTEDAGRLYRLGKLQQEVYDEPSAKKSFAAAAASFRKQVELQPDNAPLLSQFGLALSADAKDTEAESALRHAVQMAPQEARCWMALGNFLVQKANASLLNDGSTNRSITLDLLLGQLARKKPTAEQVDHALKLMDEAVACFDQAVTAASTEPQPYSQRAIGRNSREVLRVILDQLNQPAPDFNCFFKAMLLRESATDIWKAAELSKNDPEAITKAVIFEVFSSLMENRNGPLGSLRLEGVWEQLSDSTRQLVRSSLNRLDDLGQNAAPKIAASALELSGSIQDLILKDYAGAEANLRQAIALDPKQEQAWEVLTGLLVETKRYADIIPLGERRLKVNNTAHNHILLAKAYEKLNQFPRAEEQARLAFELAPKGFSANPSLCVLILKRGTDDTSLARAQGLLSRVASQNERPFTRNQYFDLSFTGGIIFALAGDSEKARQWLKRAQEFDPRNKDVNEALAAIP